MPIEYAEAFFHTCAYARLFGVSNVLSSSFGRISRFLRRTVLYADTSTNESPCGECGSAEMADSARDKERTRDGEDPVVRPGTTVPRHLTVDSCGSPVQRHLWARHAGRPGQPVVARLRARPQTQLSCPETAAATAAAAGDSTRLDGVDAQQRSRSSDGGLAQHRRRRLILKTINRSWPTSTSVTAAGARDPRSINQYIFHFIFSLFFRFWAVR